MNKKIKKEILKTVRELEKLQIQFNKSGSKIELLNKQFKLKLKLENLKKELYNNLACV